MNGTNLQLALMLELGAIEDALVLQMTRCHQSLAEAAKHVRDPQLLRVARLVAHVAQATANAAQRRAIVLDEMVEATAAEAGPVTMRAAPKPRGRRQAARP